MKMEDSKSETSNKRLTRQDLIVSPEFWIENIRTELYNIIQDYMDENGLTRKQLAEQLGVSKGYISQVLNGESDHRISKLVSLALMVGKAPYLYLKDVNKVLEEDAEGKNVYLDFEGMESNKYQNPQRQTSLPREYPLNSYGIDGDIEGRSFPFEGILVQESCAANQYGYLHGSASKGAYETDKNTGIRYKTPEISEINIRLMDANFYFGDTIDENNINVNISVKASFKEDNLIVFFIHVAYLYDLPSKKHTLFHTDYVSLIALEEAELNWKDKKAVEIEKSFLAHLLGMSFLMVRGAIMQRLSANSLSSVPLPVVNPVALLDGILKQEAENYILELGLSGH